ncbi:MAG: F-type H+-transporting ATPase subunit c [Nitrospirae bacterium]|nr:MAG: F-type H+-transporting ATPase subunit c [Nitrospirota bacterium]
MKKIIAITLLLLAFSASFAFAAEGDAKLAYYGMATIGCAVGIGLAALGCGIGMGHGLRGATEGTARNPGVSGKIMTTLIIGLAMIESLAIYALVVVLITFYANPFVK